MKKVMKPLAVFFVCLAATTVYSLSDGAFNMTGAPGEGDCSGCHTGSAVNGDAKGQLRIVIDSNDGFYESGKTYPLKVILSYSGKNRFGFALTTRKQGSANRAGSFFTTTGSGVFNRIEFVAHMRSGIDVPNQRIWEFQWKAPEGINDDITLYAAGVVSNQDNNNTGDLVYTTNLKLKKRLTNGIEPMIIRKHLHVFPNPVCESIGIDGLNPIEIVSAELLTFQGTTAHTFKPDEIRTDAGATRLLLKDDIAPASYFLHINTGSVLYTAKLVIER